MNKRRTIRIVLAIVVLGALITQAVVFFRAMRIGCQLAELIDQSDEMALQQRLATDPSLCNARLPTSGDTILNYAVEQGKLEAVDVLLEAGANPNLHGFSKRTAIHIAVQMDSSNLVLRLLRAGADIESTGYRHDDTPLHVAASHGLVDTVVLLLNHDARIDSRNMQQVTPLMRAVQNRHISVVRILLQNGANPRLLDQRHRSALDFALKNGDQKIIDLLRGKEKDSEDQEKTAM